jgi:hypothetical protein
LHNTSCITSNLTLLKIPAEHSKNKCAHGLVLRDAILGDLEVQCGLIWQSGKESDDKRVPIVFEQVDLAGLFHGKHSAPDEDQRGSDFGNGGEKQFA